jgi:hypothetical protein
MSKLTQKLTHKLGLVVSDTRVVPVEIRAVQVNNAVIIDGDVQAAVHTAMAMGLVRYFPRAQLYGVILVGYEMPSKPCKWWLFADLHHPSGYQLQPISFADTDAPSRLTTADVARGLVLECLEQAEADGLDRSAWSLDQWLNWQKQVVTDEAVGLCIDQIEHTHVNGRDNEDGLYVPPHTVGFTITFNDTSTLLLTGEGPEVPEEGTHYVREVRPGETVPTYRAVTVIFGMWGHA